MPRARRSNRVVQIRRLSDDKLLAVVAADSLKQALLDYFDRTLKGYGYKRPKVVGNVLTVTTPNFGDVDYVAKEAS